MCVEGRGGWPLKAHSFLANIFEGTKLVRCNLNMSCLVVLEQLKMSYCGKNGGLMVGSDVHLKVFESFTRGLGHSIRKIQ